MKIRALSDLHLEVAPYRYRDAGEDLVVLAGDIADGTPLAMHNREDLFHQMRAKQVVYVLGNGAASMTSRKCPSGPVAPVAPGSFNGAASMTSRK